MTAPAFDRERQAWRREQVRIQTRDGRSAADIAVALRVTERTVQRDRGALGIAQPTHERISAEKLARAEELLDDGCSYKEAARTVGISTWAITHYFPGRGWTPGEVGQWNALCQLVKAAS